MGRGEEVKREEAREKVEDAHKIRILDHSTLKKPSNYNFITHKYTDILEVLAKVCHQRKDLFCLTVLTYS